MEVKENTSESGLGVRKDKNKAGKERGSSRNISQRYLLAHA